MKHTITILDEPFDVIFSYRITAKAVPQDHDDPGAPAEFEVTDFTLSDASGNELPTPGWLSEMILDSIYADEDVQRAIADENQ